MRRRELALACALTPAVMGYAGVAGAADGAAPSDDTSPTPKDPPKKEPPETLPDQPRKAGFFDALVDSSMKRSWREGDARFFFASTIDVGFLYIRPRVSTGYGRPHDTWFGIDANPTIAGPGAGVYGGLRLAVPHFDIRVGGRYFAAFQHSFLQKRDKYTRLDLESTALPPATTLTLETEANADIPAGPGDILLLASVSYLPNVPANQNVFEESLRVIVDPPWVLRGRVGYGLRFGDHGQISVGLVGDFVHVPERKTTLVRVGPILRLALSRSFEVRGSFVPRVVSPDDLGLLDSDFTELGLRWRWGTD